MEICQYDVLLYSSGERLAKSFGQLAQGQQAFDPLLPRQFGKAPQDLRIKDDRFLQSSS